MTGPAIMTYASLVEDLTKYYERGEDGTTDPTFYDQIPQLVMLAEKQIIQDLKIQGFKEVVTGTMAAGTYTYAKPDRWRETISINFTALDDDDDFTQRTPLNQRDYTYLQMLEPDRTIQAQPKYYAEYNASNIIVSPTPDAAYPFEWSFYAIPPLLSDDQQTNWATEFVPNLLLYQCLLQSTTFLKNDERIPVWQGQYDKTIQALTVEDVRKIGDGSALRRGA